MDERYRAQQEMQSLQGQASNQGYGAYRQPAPQPCEEKSTAMVPVQLVSVAKHAVFTISKTMTPREKREFAEEFGEKVRKGFRVVQMQKAHNGLQIHITREETCTIPEFLEEITARLEER